MTLLDIILADNERLEAIVDPEVFAFARNVQLRELAGEPAFEFGRFVQRHADVEIVRLREHLTAAVAAANVNAIDAERFAEQGLVAEAVAASSRVKYHEKTVVDVENVLDALERASAAARISTALGPEPEPALELEPVRYWLPSVSAPEAPPIVALVEAAEEPPFEEGVVTEMTVARRAWWKFWGRGGASSSEV